MTEPATVRILDREFTVGVAPGEREGLVAAAHLLDARMREIRGGNRMAAMDQVAVLAALNLAHEFLQLKRELEQRDAALNRALGEINRKLDGLFDAAR